MESHRMQIGHTEILFPFKPYDVQTRYMEKVLEALRLGENAALESPTGTGKTLSLLCSSLAWLEGERIKYHATRMPELAHAVKLPDQGSDSQSTFGVASRRRIFYTSRTHSQLSQAVSELKRTAYSHVSSTVLAAREHYCINEEVLRETDRRLQEAACSEKVRSRTCYYYTNVEKKKEDPIFHSKVLDIEDLVEAGKKHSVCPYYLSKELSHNADITFAPYNYLLDYARTKKMGIAMNNAAVIIDEAHNVEQVCEEVASREMKLSDIALCIAEVDQVITDFDKYQQALMLEVNNPEATNFNKEDLEVLKSSFLKIEEAINKIAVGKEGKKLPGEEIFEILSKGYITKEKWNEFKKFCDDLANFLSGSSGRAIFKRHGAGLLSFATFLEGVFTNSTSPGIEGSVGKYFRVHIRAEENFIKKRSDWLTASAVFKAPLDKILSFWCFSPSFTMRQLGRQGIHCLILTSGTLAPLDGFVAQMQISIPIRLENPHIIDDSQVYVAIVKKGVGGVPLNSSYQNRSNPEYLKALGILIQNVSRQVKPGGVLVFFPSYAAMDSCKNFWENSGLWAQIANDKRIYVESKQKSDFTDSMNNYYDDVKNRGGAIFMAVCRGKVSEGLDFANDNGRAVIITGIPYSNHMDPKISLKRSYLDEMRRDGEKVLSGSDWYTQEASRAVNQAIGRVIRHRTDYGAIILAESRFANNNFTNNLSAWVRPKIQMCDMFGSLTSGVLNFFKTVRADPRLQVRAERAVVPANDGRSQRNVNSHLMPGKSPGLAMKVVSKRTMAEFSARPPPAKSNSKGDAALMAQYLAEDEAENSRVGSSGERGLYGALERASGDGPRKKMRIVLPNRDEEVEAPKPEVNSAKDKEKKSALFLNKLKTSLKGADYETVKAAVMSYRNNKDLNRFADALDDILLVKHQLPELFCGLEDFLAEKHKVLFRSLAEARIPEYFQTKGQQQENKMP